MSTIEEIKTAIEKLSLEERAELARWLHGWADDGWDKQMCKDLNAGRLDKLIADADAAVASRQLEDLP